MEFLSSMAMVQSTPEPADIAVLDDLSKCDIDLVKRCLEAFDGRSLRVPERSSFLATEKRKLTIYFESSLESSISNTPSSVPSVALATLSPSWRKTFYEMFGIASARRWIWDMTRTFSRKS